MCRGGGGVSGGIWLNDGKKNKGPLLEKVWLQAGQNFEAADMSQSRRGKFGAGSEGYQACYRLARFGPPQRLSDCHFAGTPVTVPYFPYARLPAN